MSDTKIRKLVLAALFAALCTIMTLVIQVPSPMQGYVNLGDCAVLLSAWVLGPLYGGAAARRRFHAGGPSLRLRSLCSWNLRYQAGDGRSGRPAVSGSPTAPRSKCTPLPGCERLCG